MKKRCWLLAIGFWLAPVVAIAATDSTAMETARGRPVVHADSARSWWIGVWAGAAPHSEFQTRLGPRHRDLYMAGVRFGRPLSVSPRLAVDYFVDVVPLIRSTKTPVAYREARCDGRGMPCIPTVVMETATVHGYGLVPIGFQLRAFPQNRVQLVFGLSAGAAWYDKPVPDPDEKRFNFMSDITVGVQLRAGRSGAVLAGFRQNHTSNANSGPANPGLDSRVGYLGVIRSLGRRSQS